MAAVLHKIEQRRLIDSDGIADGAAIFFYLTGTLTLAPIYSDVELAVPRANPVLVPSGGLVPDVYLDSTITYRRRIVYLDGEVEDTDPWISTINSEIVSFNLDYPNAVPTDLLSRGKNIVYLTDFGAACDGTTDDSAALQDAIDDALAASVTPTLVVPGPCRIASPVNIDRMVDTTTSYFKIVGSNPESGFIYNGITAFTSTITPNGAQPRSEFISFEGIRFDGSGHANSVAFSERFLRMRFTNCDFQGTRCLKGTTTFAQEWTLERCRVRAAPAGNYFFDSQGAYYVNSHGTKYQNCGSGIFDLHHDTYETGVVGCSFVQDIIESNAGTFVRAGAVLGMLITGCYNEKDDAAGTSVPWLDFTVTMGGTNKGIAVIANQSDPSALNTANVNFYNIVWGTGGGYAAANSCLSNLHDNSACTLVNFTSQNDVVPGTKKKYRFDFEAQAGLIPDLAEGYATKIYASLVTVTPSNLVATHSVALPSPKKGMKISVINTLNSVGARWTMLPGHSADGSRFRGSAANVGREVDENEALFYYCVEDGIWDFATAHVQISFIAAPTGGATVDTEARAQLAALLTALKNSGRMAKV